MVESASERSLGEFTDPEIEYRSVEPLAVGGLLLGLVSPVALIAPLLWLVPPLGILANALALRRLAHESGRIGRAAALVGLGLSVLFAVAPLAQSATAFVILRGQARPVADQFLEYMRQGRPEKAVMLRTTPDVRTSLESLDDDGLWLFFRHNGEAKNDLTSLANLPLARTLMTLGEKADVRFFRTVGLGFKGDQAEVNYWYTVTFVDASGQKKTFLVGVILERKPSQSPDASPWRVKELYGPIDNLGSASV